MINLNSTSQNLENSEWKQKSTQNSLILANTWYINRKQHYWMADHEIRVSMLNNLKFSVSKYCWLLRQKFPKFKMELFSKRIEYIS